MATKQVYTPDVPAITAHSKFENLLVPGHSACVFVLPNFLCACPACGLISNTASGLEAHIKGKKDRSCCVEYSWNLEGEVQQDDDGNDTDLDLLEKSVHDDDETVRNEDETLLKISDDAAALLAVGGKPSTPKSTKQKKKSAYLELLVVVKVQVVNNEISILYINDK